MLCRREVVGGEATESSEVRFIAGLTIDDVEDEDASDCARDNDGSSETRRVAVGGRDIVRRMRLLFCNF
jgi:hypothetical protein